MIELNINITEVLHFILKLTSHFSHCTIEPSSRFEPQTQLMTSSTLNIHILHIKNCAIDTNTIAKDN